MLPLFVIRMCCEVILLFGKETFFRLNTFHLFEFFFFQKQPFVDVLQTFSGGIEIEHWVKLG